jgi:hypothetical protein
MMLNVILTSASHVVFGKIGKIKRNEFLRSLSCLSVPVASARNSSIFRVTGNYTEGRKVVVFRVVLPPVCRRAPEAPRFVGLFRVFGNSIFHEKILNEGPFLQRSLKKKEKNPCDE